MIDKICGIFTVLCILYLFNDSIVDVYENFGVYFPFLNVTTYLDLIKHVAIPRVKSGESAQRLFSVEELKQYNGQNKNELYISILGNVFDVSTGVSYYGIGRTYHQFTGRDASRAFISGDFSEQGLTDDVLDLSFQDLIQLKEWLKMYETKYKYKGKLIGRYFQFNGEPSNYNKELQVRFLRAEEDKSMQEMEKQAYPPCNVEWTADKGSRVWCTTQSGGIERNWSGVPRKLFMPGSKSYRCACVNKDNSQEDSISKFLVEYEKCDPNAYTCYVKT